MSFLRTSGSGSGRLTGYGRLAPVRPPAGGSSGIRFGGSPVRPRGLRQWAMAKDSPLRHVDWVLLTAVLALALIGTLLVWSATQPELAQAGLNPRTYLEKQLLNVAIGLVLMVAASLASYRQLRLFTPLAYLAACLGLLVVLSPLGTTVNGAHSWISLPGGFQIEPSEFAKIGMILILAMILGDLRDRLPRPGLRELALALAAGAVPLVLVALQPDLGVTVLLLVLLLGVIALSGIRLRWLAGLGVAGLLGGLAAWSMHLLKPYQMQRLAAFANPSADPRGAGYSAAQAKIAIGSGRMFGQGLFHGQLVAGNFVPEQHTDFIFSVAGEELGFAGCITIIALLAIVLVRALRIAARADDMFGLLAASGIAIWFGVQSFINIGMTIGITPVTGLPLPFVSYGGSAMFADMLAIGVLLAIHRRHRVFD
ncbi:MAG TPA: rod shape-determining protein RodA [Streptosporangiaceae bacterium]|jgi:rod shape determining protein RodA|nr:rod shape-determining protein RodA [Streptosporangiaceae bacterium]